MVTPAQSVDPEDSADNSHQRIADPTDIGVDRHQQVGIAVGLVVYCLEARSLTLSKILHGLLFMAEHLDYLLPVQHFLDESIYDTQIHLLFDIKPS